MSSREAETDRSVSTARNSRARIAVAVTGLQTGSKAAFKHIAWAKLWGIARFQAVEILAFAALSTTQTDVRISHVVALFITVAITVGKSRMRKHRGRAGLAQMEVLRPCSNGDTCSEKER